MRDLSVMIQYGEVTKEIWKIYGNHGRKWNRADVVFVGPSRYNVNISFILQKCYHFLAI